MALITGIFIGIASAMAIAIPMWGAPKLIKRFITNHPFATDVIVGAGVYAATTAVSSSIAAIVGTVVSGLCITALITALKMSPDLRAHFMKGTNPVTT